MQASIGFITVRYQTRTTDNPPQETISEFYFSEMWGREGPVLKTSFIGLLKERTLAHLKLETVAKQQPLFFPFAYYGCICMAPSLLFADTCVYTTLFCSFLQQIPFDLNLGCLVSSVRRQ